MKGLYPDLPVYGVGLSLGGATAYHLSLKNKSLFEAIVMMAPALGYSVDFSNKSSLAAMMIGLFGKLLPSSLGLFNISPLDNCRNQNY